MPDAPNPERRSDAALICFGLGAVLAGGAYFLGLGAVITMAMAGGNPVAVAGGVVSAILLAFMGVAGAVLMLVGIIWIFVRVVADSRAEHSKERYSREVER